MEEGGEIWKECFVQVSRLSFFTYACAQARGTEIRFHFLSRLSFNMFSFFFVLVDLPALFSHSESSHMCKWYCRGIL